MTTTSKHHRLSMQVESEINRIQNDLQGNRCSPEPEIVIEELQTANQPERQEWKPNQGEWFIFICLAIISLVIALDTTILVPVLPLLSDDLGGSTVDAFWAGTAYLLTCAIFQPFIVSLSDSFGRQELLFISVALFTIGTLICCLAQDFLTMHAGRSIQGIGGGGTLSLCLVIMTDIVPLRQRPTYLGIIQVAWVLGTVAGPTAGGGLAERSTWRWAFYINFPFCAAALIMVPLSVRLRAPRVSLQKRLLHTDWIGAAIFISSSCSFLIGITWGGTQYPWKSWKTLLPIILGIFGSIGMLFWERHGAPQPFIRLWLFSNTASSAAYACAVLQGLLMYGTLYHLPMYLEAIQGLTPTMTGAGLLPISSGLIPSSIVAGIVITRLGHYRWAVWSGWAITMMSAATLLILSDSTPTYGWVLLFFFLGPGQGLLLTSLNSALQALSQEGDVAYAAAMYTFMRSFGMCLGVAIGGTVFQNRLLVHLKAHSLDEDVASDAQRFIVVMGQMADGPMLSAYREAYAEAFRNVFQVLGGVAILGGLTSLFIKHADMNRALESNHVLHKRASQPAMVTGVDP